MPRHPDTAIDQQNAVQNRDGPLCRSHVGGTPLTSDDRRLISAYLTKIEEWSDRQYQKVERFLDSERERLRLAGHEVPPLLLRQRLELQQQTDGADQAFGVRPPPLGDTPFPACTDEQIEALARVLRS